MRSLLESIVDCSVSVRLVSRPPIDTRQPADHVVKSRNNPTLLIVSKECLQSLGIGGKGILKHGFIEFQFA